MIDKQSPIPIYYQLEEMIKKKIQSEELMPGEAIPSEREYAETYGISRMTVRQAINNMVTEGLLYRQKGRGTFIAEQKIEQDLTKLTSFSEDMRNRELNPSSKLISIDQMACSVKIAEALAINAGACVYQIKRLRLADEEPIALETIYTPKNLVGDMDETDFNQSFYTFLEENRQLKIHHGHQSIEASTANKDEIKYLKIKKNDPILLMYRTSYLINQTPIEFVKSSYRADKYKFYLTMNR
ncbi:GntR family transcriptional regulator [Amphibacillus sp. Q70]|uniref:GntR family transcriptional regulator n=1 Tax=Amphibacillus sp. Q70 TaxID=3453416 RepID=UPI003F842357